MPAPSIQPRPPRRIVRPSRRRPLGALPPVGVPPRRLISQPRRVRGLRPSHRTGVNVPLTRRPVVPPIPPRRTRLYRVRRGTVVCVPPITTGPVTGTIAVTAADATSAISAFVGEQGTIAVTVADTTSVITANIGEQGTIAVTAGDATSVMTGTVTAPAGNTPAHGGLEHFVWPHPTPQRTAVQRPYQLLVPRRPYAGDLNVTTSGATATITAIFDISALEDEELLLDLI